jgi:hypothetical protein
VELPFSELVRDYTTFASGLVERWGALASRSAAELDAGTYDASSAAEDAAGALTLAAEEGWSWTALTWQAVAKWCGVDYVQNTAESQPFDAPAGAKLTLRAAPTNGPGLETLPGVTIDPEQLGAEQTQFTLRTDGTVCRGATYVAVVEATTDEGLVELFVWITVL